jgi:glycogen debranching enzyme
VIGRLALAESLSAKAASLRSRFEEAFWCPDIGTYALALDGEKRPCKVVASNAGHTLLTGIAAHAHAGDVVRSLMSSESFSGWGIRTLASSESRYNPMSYHNGSVWPHDNALIAHGFARYDFRDEAMLVLNGLFEASVYVELHRLPELFCGFSRRAGESPTLYPVACSPQSWAAGAAFLLLRATLGLDVLATERAVRFTRARLPAYLDEVRIRNLHVGTATLDLVLERHHHNVSIDVVRRDGEVEIVAIK